MNIKKILLTLLILVSGHVALAEHLHPEKYYQTLWCNSNGGTMEYALQDKTRVDCLTNDYAVEFDFAKKWAESIGQSLYYGEMTGRQPAIGLIIENSRDNRYYYRILPLCNRYGIKLFRVS